MRADTYLFCKRSLEDRQPVACQVVLAAGPATELAELERSAKRPLH
jgi:hypothetical protein